MCFTQVLLNMLDFGMNPQEALDAPRIFVKFDKSGKCFVLECESSLRFLASSTGKNPFKAQRNYSVPFVQL